MAIQRRGHRQAAAECSLALALTCAFFPAISCAQIPMSPPVTAVAPSRDELMTAIDEVKHGDYSGVMSVVHFAGITKAIPILEPLFLSSKDSETKEFIAATLMDLGDSKDIYMDFLLQQANEAIDNDAPPLTDTDAQGRQINAISPAFTAWAKSHNMDASQAGELVLYTLPGHVSLLGRTHDKRAIPVLQRALKAHGFLISVSGAEGLAELQDRDSIPLIVDACKNSPPEIAVGIASSALVYFDDPRAQSAAAIYLPLFPDMLKSFEGKKLYRGPFPSAIY